MTANKNLAKVPKPSQGSNHLSAHAAENADWETIALSTNRQFIELIERSRERHKAEGGISSAEMRKRLKAKTTTRSK